MSDEQGVSSQLSLSKYTSIATRTVSSTSASTNLPVVTQRSGAAGINYNAPALDNRDTERSSNVSTGAQTGDSKNDDNGTLPWWELSIKLYFQPGSLIHALAIKRLILDNWSTPPTTLFNVVLLYMEIRAINYIMTAISVLPKIIRMYRGMGDDAEDSQDYFGV